jgi:hypothetical protein
MVPMAGELRMAPHPQPAWRRTLGKVPLCFHVFEVGSIFRHVYDFYTSSERQGPGKKPCKSKSRFLGNVRNARGLTLIVTRVLVGPLPLADSENGFHVVESGQECGFLPRARDPTLLRSLRLHLCIDTMACSIKRAVDY